MYFTGYNYKGIIGITFQMFRALNLCISKEEEFNYMFSAAWLDKDNNMLYASDGKMGIAFDIPEEIKKTEKISTGYYMPVQNGKKYYLIPYKLASKFPDMEKVIPNYDNDQIVMTNEQYLSNMTKNTQFIFRLFEKIENPIDLERLSVLKYISSFNVKYQKDKAVLFYNDHVKFIIMPLIKY